MDKVYICTNPECRKIYILQRQARCSDCGWVTEDSGISSEKWEKMSDEDRKKFESDPSKENELADLKPAFALSTTLSILGTIALLIGAALVFMALKSSSVLLGVPGVFLLVIGIMGLVNGNKGSSKVGEAIAEREKEKSQEPDRNPVSAADEIKKYKDLLDAGAITQEEYDAKKKQLLNL